MKKLLSYLLPFTLKKYESKINGELKVVLINGRKMLDTPKSNYSYGPLQQILHQGLTAAGFNSRVNSVLVLGLGGGSVVSTIRDDFRSKASIQLVDIDPVVIDIAKHEFGLMSYSNISITEADAALYVSLCQQTFDVVIIDLFIIDTVPEIFTQTKFINDVCQCLNTVGQVIFNTMRQTLPHGVFDDIKTSFLMQGLNIKVLERVEYTNDLLIATKV